LPDLREEIVHLAPHRPHVHLGIDQPGGTDDLLDHDSLGKLQLEVARGGRQVDHLGHQIHELIEVQRSVVERRRQTEAVLDQRQLPGPVSVVHAGDLGQAHVRLVHHRQEVRREIVDETGGPFPFLPPGEVPGVVLDPGAGAHLEQHLDIEVGA